MNFTVSLRQLGARLLSRLAFYPERTDRVQQPVQTPWRRLVVLRYQDYEEVTAFYQVEDEKELRKILRLELQDSNQPTLFSIGEVMDGRRQVCFYRLKESVAEMLHPWLPSVLIPESWLIRQTYPDQLVSFESPNERLWVLSYHGLNASVLAQGLMQHASVFCAAAGVPELHAQTLTREQLNQQLMLAPSILLQRQLASFFYHDPKQKFDSQSWALGGLIASISFGLTLMLYGFVVDWQLRQAGQTQVELTSKVGPLLELQARIEQSAKDIELLQSLDASSGRIKYELWRVLSPLIEQQDIRISRVMALAESNSYTIYGKAPKATQVLQLLSQQAGIRSASFVSDVTSSGDLEQFIIQFSME